MPIEKAIVAPSGATAAYWVITEARMNVLARVADCTMRGWLDQAAFEAGRQPLDVRYFRFGPEQLDQTGAEVPITDLLTTLILATPEFAPQSEPEPEPESDPAPEPAP